MIYVMTSPDVVSYEIVPEAWTAHSLLQRIASANEPKFHALIDTGALITGMTNFEVSFHAPFCIVIEALECIIGCALLARSRSSVVRRSRFP
jgi:hypothetical protein